MIKTWKATVVGYTDENSSPERVTRIRGKRDFSFQVLIGKCVCTVLAVTGARRLSEGYTKRERRGGHKHGERGNTYGIKRARAESSRDERVTLRLRIPAANTWWIEKERAREMKRTKKQQRPVRGECLPLLSPEKK